MDEFARKPFLEADTRTREKMCAELSRKLSRSIASAYDFHREVRRLVEQLRQVGHDLWSIDESDEHEIWGPNYQSPTGPGIVVTFSADDGVEVEWTEQ